MNSHPVPRRPLTENPWFWVHLFSVAGLIGLFLVNQKADTLQAQRDANFTLRQHSLDRQSGGVRPPPETSAAETLQQERHVTFTPFYTLLGIVTVVSWWMVWRRHFRPAAPHPARNSA
jgi:hypothetical protein